MMDLRSSRGAQLACVVLALALVAASCTTRAKETEFFGLVKPPAENVLRYVTGDEPESLNEGLHAAIQRVSWADDAVRLSFLVADAPPHLDYTQDYDYGREALPGPQRAVRDFFRDKPMLAVRTEQGIGIIIKPAP